MKTTPFTEKHIALGAKMHEFAGYNMPIEYSGIIDEHLTVCNAVGVFDVSHMGEFWVKGPNALAFLQQVTSNNVAVLPIPAAPARSRGSGTCRWSSAQRSGRTLPQWRRCSGGCGSARCSPDAWEASVFPCAQACRSRSRSR